MSTKVVMEALSPTMEEGRLVEWKKQVGEPVAVGEPHVDHVTDDLAGFLKQAILKPA